MARTDSPSTGPMRFDGDWPGFFLRGDNASDLCNHIDAALALGDQLSQIQKERLRDYVREIRSCRQASATGEGQELKSWADCQPSSKDK